MKKQHSFENEEKWEQALRLQLSASPAEPFSVELPASSSPVAKRLRLRPAILAAALLTVAVLLSALLLPAVLQGKAPAEPAENDSGSEWTDMEDDPPVSLTSEECERILSVLNPDRQGPAGAVDPDAAFETAFTELSFRLLQKMVQAKPQSSRMVSAYSLACALGMIGEGADGKTLAQIETLLGGMPVDAFCARLAGYTVSLPESQGAQVVTANAVFLAKDGGIALHPSYLPRIDRYFNADVAALDLQDPSKAAAAVNAWCDRNTSGRIARLVNSTDFASGFSSFVANAITFDAAWETEFEPLASREEPFYGAAETTVKMLYGPTDGESMGYIEGEHEIGVVKLYQDQGYAFVGLLPEEGISTEEYLSTLSGAYFRTLWENRTDRTVALSMPEFQVDDHTELRRMLMRLGMTDAFDPDAADFTRMLPSGAYLGFVRQNCHLEVDANGTRGAAATGGGWYMGVGPEMTVVTFNRPFVYAIVDTENGLPLFLGCYMGD